MLAHPRFLFIRVLTPWQAPTSEGPVSDAEPTPGPSHPQTSNTQPEAPTSRVRQDAGSSKWPSWLQTKTKMKHETLALDGANQTPKRGQGAIAQMLNTERVGFILGRDRSWCSIRRSGTAQRTGAEHRGGCYLRPGREAEGVYAYIIDKSQLLTPNEAGDGKAAGHSRKAGSFS